MKRPLLFFVLCLYLLSATGLGELLKTPLLLAHYTEHCKQNPGMSFSEFLEDHYLSDDGNDADNATDDQLPFKQYDPETAACFIPLSCLEVKTTYTEATFPVSHERFLPSSTLSSIWQPPKSL